MHRGRQPSLRRALRNRLLSLGVGVETFDSGGAFLEAGNRGRIASPVLDVRMAGMSGVNVLRQLAGVAIPTIVRTVHGDDETRSHRTGREGPRAPQSTAAPPARPGMGTEKRG